MPIQDYKITESTKGISVQCPDKERSCLVRAALLLKGIDPKRLFITDKEDAKSANTQTVVAIQDMKTAEFAEILKEGEIVFTGFFPYSHVSKAPLEKGTCPLRYSKSEAAFQVVFSLPKDKDSYRDIARDESNPYALFARENMRYTYRVPAHITKFEASDGRGEIAKICINTKPGVDVLGRMITMLEVESKSAVPAAKAADSLRRPPVNPRSVTGGQDSPPSRG